MQEPHQVAQKLIVPCASRDFQRSRLRSAAVAIFQLYRLLFDLPERFRTGRGFLLPLCRAAENTRVFHGHFSVRQQSVDRIPGVRVFTSSCDSCYPCGLRSVTCDPYRR